MSGLKQCPTCGSGNAIQASHCWICGTGFGGRAPTAQPPPRAQPVPYQPLPTQPLPHQPLPPRSPTHRAARRYELATWLALLTGLGFTTLLIAFELLMNWPGLLIPYSVIVLVSFAAVGRTAHVHLRMRREGGAEPAGPDDSGEQIVNSLALGLTIAICAIAALALLAVASVILFMVICTAVLMGLSVR